MAVPRTIREAIQPLLLVNILIGMGHFEFRPRAMKFIEIVYSAIYVTAFTLLASYADDYFDVQYFRTTLDITQAMAQWIYYSNGIVMVSLIITARINTDKLQTAMDLIDTCDQRMENMRLPKLYRALYRQQIYVLGLVGAIAVGFMTITYQWQYLPRAMSAVKLLFAVVMNIPLVLVLVSDISFGILIRHTRFKFNQLNGLLRDMVTTTPDMPRHERIAAITCDFGTTKRNRFRNDRSYGGNGNAKTMRAVKQIHLDLIKISRTINDAYGMQILLTMSVSFIFITCLLYISYRIVWLELPPHQFVQEITSPACWIIIYVLKIFVENHMCAKTSSAAAETGDIICELYEPSTAKEFRAEIRDFTLQMIQNPLVFTACGFFDMDHTFIQAVVGTITTYLVILIQVGDISKPNYEPLASVGNATSNETLTTQGTTN